MPRYKLSPEERAAEKARMETPVEDKLTLF
jgi:hypothetical protein